MKIETIKKVTISIDELVEKLQFSILAPETVGRLIYINKIAGENKVTLEFLVEPEKDF